ncbi:hypothetical protein LTR53_017018, partial [Teratosphaeriaceae sp. CCFEE 6253]
MWGSSCSGSLLLLLASTALGLTSSTGITRAGTLETATSEAIATSDAPSSRGERSRGSNATCASRTVNYITHTLPQQCLRTDWRPSNGTHTPSSAVNSTSREPEPSATAGALDQTLELPIHNAGVSSNATPAATSGTASAAEAAISSPAKVTSLTLTVSESQAAAAASPSVVDEEESLFDSAAFLSFKEWKKQNLAKTGQSAENVGQERPQSGERQRPGI